MPDGQSGISLATRAGRDMKKWPASGRISCVHCGHLRGDHSRSGVCVEPGCPCRSFLRPSADDGTLVVTPEQLRHGYTRNPSVPLGGHAIQHENASFQVVDRLEDGNYLVVDPAVLMEQSR